MALTPNGAPSSTSSIAASAMRSVDSSGVLGLGIGASLVHVHVSSAYGSRNPHFPNRPHVCIINEYHSFTSCTSSCRTPEVPRVPLPPIRQDPPAAAQRGRHVRDRHRRLPRREPLAVHDRGRAVGPRRRRA